MAAWPSMPSDFKTDQVIWIPITWTVDPVKGGRVMVKGTPVGPLSCLVQGKKAIDDRGHYRESMIGTYDVMFDIQVKFNLRDQLVWISSRSEILNILGIWPVASGTGRIWHCTCEEHRIS